MGHCRRPRLLCRLRSGGGFLMEALCRVIGRSICHSAPGTLVAQIRSPGSLTSWILRQNMDQITAALLWTAAAWKGGGRGGSVWGGTKTKKKQPKKGVCFVSTAPEGCFLHLSAAFPLVFRGAPCLCSGPTSAVTARRSAFCCVKRQEGGEGLGGRGGGRRPVAG